jgi:mRNA interferase HicA
LLNIIFNDNIQALIMAGQIMKYSEFRRFLTSRGVTITPGKGSHHKVSLNGRDSVFPDHGAKEMPKGLMLKIRKELGL